MPGKTIRDSDGLAISSRNVRLSAKDRESALVISQALISAHEKETLSLMQEALEKVLSSEPLFRPDYACIIDEDTFELAIEATPNKRALIAGWVNGLRLIDNMPMKISAR